MTDEQFLKIKNNYLYRSDINVLIDKRCNRFIYVNDTANIFLKYTFENEKFNMAIKEISKYFKMDLIIIEQDYKEFFEKVEKQNSSYADVSSRGGFIKNIDYEKIEFPFSIEIEITKACNWDCKFCYNIWKYTSEQIPQIHMCIQDYKMIIDECVNNRALGIRLSGGEPTLHPRFLEFVEYAASKQLEISIFTNGTQINSEILEKMQELKVKQILFSLHGDKAKHNEWVGHKNAYDKVIEAIQKAIKYNFIITIETIITGETTREDLLKVAKVLKSNNIVNWNLMPYVPTGKQDQQLKASLKELNKNIIYLQEKYPQLHMRVPCSPKWCMDKNKAITNEKEIPISAFDANCGAGILWCSISYDGYIRHCPHSSNYGGSIKEGIKKVFKNKIIPNVLRGMCCDEFCDGCIVKDKCKGGCYLRKVTYGK